MDKKLLGLAAASVCFSVGTAAAGVMNPTSYAELLKPIPNAVSTLKEVDSKPIEKAQVFFGFGHHHHNWHHHHHHHGYYHHHHHGWYHHHHGWHHHHHGWHHHHHHHH